MDVTVSRTGDSAWFEIKGKIDERGAEELKARFKKVNASSLKEAVFDFKRVSRIGSAGLGKLLLFYKALSANHGNIRIENTNRDIHDLLLELQLDSIFTITGEGAPAGSWPSGQGFIL